jgi:hypothetical protein
VTPEVQQVTLSVMRYLGMLKNAHVPIFGLKCCTRPAGPASDTKQVQQATQSVTQDAASLVSLEASPLSAAAALTSTLVYCMVLHFCVC